MMNKFFSITGIMLFCIHLLMAQSADKPARPAIIDNIRKNSEVVIFQDSKLDNLIISHINRKIEVGSGTYTGFGYRVQVFSSNAQKTAKNEAYSVERKLRSAFPGYAVYRIYASPFWKVRIGDFKTLEDAKAFRSELVKVFPELSRETYPVRESKISIR